MQDERLESYWQDIPKGSLNAASYNELMYRWSKNKREVRRILHELSYYDNGDDYILIRSGRTNGFYRTKATTVIEEYRREVLKKGKSTFAPLKKINRVLSENPEQIVIDL